YIERVISLEESPAKPVDRTVSTIGVAVRMAVQNPFFSGGLALASLTRLLPLARSLRDRLRTPRSRRNRTARRRFPAPRDVVYSMRTFRSSPRNPRRLPLLDRSTFARGADAPMPSSSFAQRIRLVLEQLEERSVPTLLGQQLYPSDNPWNQRV